MQKQPRGGKNLKKDIDDDKLSWSSSDSDEQYRDTKVQASKFAVWKNKLLNRNKSKEKAEDEAALAAVKAKIHTPA